MLAQMVLRVLRVLVVNRERVPRPAGKRRLADLFWEQEIQPEVKLQVTLDRTANLLGPMAHKVLLTDLTQMILGRIAHLRTEQSASSIAVVLRPSSLIRPDTASI
jgi:hypothetical protein